MKNSMPFYFMFIVLFFSCSWYGSTGRIHNKTFSGGKVLLMVDHDRIDRDLLLHELLSRLVDHPYLKIEYADYAHTPLSFKRSPLYTEYHQKVDGYIFIYGTTRNYSDTILELELFDPAFELVITASHNTFMGNSYFFPPALERTIADASHGLVKVFDRKLSKIIR